MAKNFRDDLRRRNMASLIPTGKEEEQDQQQQDSKPEQQPAAGQAPAPREKTKPEPVAKAMKETVLMEPGEEGAEEKDEEAGQKARRGRKPTGTDKQPVTFRLDEDLIFDLKAAAFWDRRDFTEIVTIGLQKYLETLDQGELRRARREFRKRLEEGR